jgi:hypothetical protein
MTKEEGGVDIRIDRLRLRVAGIDEESAQRLAGLIAQRLRASIGEASLSGATPAGVAELGRLDVTLRARAGDSLDDLADGAATEVLRALEAT